MRSKLCLLAPFLIAIGAALVGQYASSFVLGLGISMIGFGLCTVIVGATEKS